MEYKEGRVDLGDVVIATKCWGNMEDKSKPTLLCLHGWLDNAASFDLMAPYLSLYYRMVCIDFVGHGLSTSRPQGCNYYMWENVSDVIRLLNALGVDKINLLGHSMGAIVSVMTAVSAPERVNRICLIDGVFPMPGNPDDTATNLKRFITAIQALPDKQKRIFKSEREAIEARMNGIFPLSEQAAELLCRRGLRMVKGGLTWSTDKRLTVINTPIRMTFPETRNLVESLETPALLMVGSEGMYSKQEEFHDLIMGLPHMTIKELPGNHHLHMHESAIPCAEAVHAFLKQDQES